MKREKKPRKSNCFTGSANKTPATTKHFTEEELWAFLKRISEASGEDGRQVLKSICLDSNTDKGTNSTEKPNNTNNKTSGDDYKELGHAHSGQKWKIKYKINIKQKCNIGALHAY